MSLLIPGYQGQANLAREKQAAELRLDRLPWSPHMASTQIHLIQTLADAEAFVAQIQKSGVSMLGIDTEFTFDRPPIELPNGKEFIDHSTIRPQVCSVAAWCGACQSASADHCDLMIRGVFNLGCLEVYPALREVFGLGLPWVAHAASAELHCLWACGIEPPEHLLIDTFIVAACLNNGRFHRRNKGSSITDDIAGQRQLEEKSAHITSLVGQCERYGIPHPFAVNKDVMRRKFLALGPTDPLDAEMLEYAASDAEYALRLYFAQQPDIDRFGLGPHLQRVEFPLIPTAARMELTGVPFDRQKALKYLELCRQIAVLFAERLTEYQIQAGSRNSFLAAMGRAGLLRHFQSRDGKYSTNRETLKRCEEIGVHPAVRLFRLHRHFQRMALEVSTYLNLVSEDGRLRYSLRQLGSASGRISSVRPNLIGLDSRLRPMIGTAGTDVLVELDKSQIEVGLAGAVWNDPALIKLFNTDDAYAAIAQSFFRDQISPVEQLMNPKAFKAARPDLRKNCKALMLGALYGLGEESLASKLKCSTEQAADELRRFFEHFPGAAKGAQMTIETALVNGYGTTATGLRRFINVGDRRLARSMRNHPVQGVAAAIFKTAIARIDRHFRGTAVRLLVPRHDSILIQTPAELQDEVISTCKLFMVQAVREIYPNLKPRVEFKSGTSWPTEKTLEAFYDDEILKSSRSAPASGLTEDAPGKISDDLAAPDSAQTIVE